MNVEEATPVLAQIAATLIDRQASEDEQARQFTQLIYRLMLSTILVQPAQI